MNTEYIGKELTQFSTYYVNVLKLELTTNETYFLMFFFDFRGLFSPPYFLAQSTSFWIS